MSAPRQPRHAAEGRGPRPEAASADPGALERQLSQMIVGSWVTQAIAVAAELAVADRLADGPKTAEDLAREAGVHAPSLHRLLRALASAGRFAQEDGGRFALTGFGTLLAGDAPGSKRALALMAGTEFYRSWGGLLGAVRTGAPAFETVFGAPFFSYMERNPERWRIYDAAMNGVHGAETRPVLDACDLSDVRRLVDVGGGTGAAASSGIARPAPARDTACDSPGDNPRWRRTRVSGTKRQKTAPAGGSAVDVTFFGTRGSVPVPEPEFAMFGGNTSSVLIAFDHGRVALLDAGTGIRKAGRHIAERGIGQFDNLIIGLSHTHWDHIQGFPFFGPAYDARRNLTLALSGHAAMGPSLESVFTTQMQQEFFPVPLAGMGARIVFWQPDDQEVTTPSGVRIGTARHAHPGGAYGYRISHGGKTVVYCTDVEHGERLDPDVVSLARGADLLIHDAQYTPAELGTKRGWGHSSWEQAIEVAAEAGVAKVALFHHDPEHDDAFLLGVERETQRLFPNSFLAREGLTVSV